MKSACALLLVGSLSAIAPTAQASSYWESKVSNKDVRWDAKTQSFGYETWLNKRNKKPGKWRLAKLNYIKNNYFVIDGKSYNKKGTGTKEYLNSPTEISWSLKAYSDHPLHENKMYISSTNSGTFSKETIYNDINLNGLKKIHDDGWTGSNIEIRTVEPSVGTHGYNVAKITKVIAPNSYNIISGITSGGQLTSTNDITNNSFGIHRNERSWSESGTCSYNLNTCYTGNPSWNPHPDESSKDHWINEYNLRLNAANNALHIYSAGNNGEVKETGLKIGNTETSNTDWIYDPIFNDYYYNYTTTGTAIDNTDCTTAGGNNTADSCTDIKWIYDEDEDVSRTIWVGAVGENSDGSKGSQTSLADYSVSAGSTAMFDFIVADGSDPFSNNRGTSYAAPRVTGAAALVMHKFGTNAKQTKAIILNTADDLGATGIDEVFGHGLLNVSKALSPVGKLN